LLDTMQVGCSTVVQVPGLPEATSGHATPSGFPCVCACATASCAIFALVGPFHQKWRYETSPVVTDGHVTPFGVPLGEVRACVIGSALWFPPPISSMATGTSPFTGYLPLLLAPSIITQKFVVFGYVRGCCVVLQGCPRSHCGISKSQMNEMVNLIPTCIVSNKKLVWWRYFRSKGPIKADIVQLPVAHVHIQGLTWPSVTSGSHGTCTTLLYFILLL
jgi:hypothetical protein